MNILVNAEHPVGADLSAIGGTPIADKSAPTKA